MSHMVHIFVLVGPIEKFQSMWICPIHPLKFPVGQASGYLSSFCTSNRFLARYFRIIILLNHDLFTFMPNCKTGEKGNFIVHQEKQKKRGNCTASHRRMVHKMGCLFEGSICLLQKKINCLTIWANMLWRPKWRSWKGQNLYIFDGGEI